MKDSSEELILNLCRQAMSLLSREQQIVVVITALICACIRDYRERKSQ